MHLLVWNSGRSARIPIALSHLRDVLQGHDFKAALNDPAPGIFDQCPWAKWNQHYGRTPMPHFGSDGFQAQIPPQSPISFPPNPEGGDIPKQVPAAGQLLSGGQAKEVATSTDAFAG